MKKKSAVLKISTFVAVCLFALNSAANAQKTPPNTENKLPVPKTEKKANQRPDAPKPALIEPFDKADVKTMAAQCVKFDTEAGAIELEMFPENAPESVRSFLNLAAAGAFDTTIFSRVVPGFIIQGGDLFTNQKMTPELGKRSRRTLPDEPSQIKHERGILSMARADEPNTASTHFFILLSETSTLDGKFAAFGRVINGMETVEAINKMPVEGEKLVKPVRITRAAVAPCQISAKVPAS
jgi:peptidyl-prolyl cis-trans isomerase B (cyclophilin B)